MGFQSVYKRHTPFAISSYDYTIQGDRITIDKSGDVLLYMYLYSDTGVDWYSIKSIDMLLGGQIISSWDIKYLTKFAPFLASTYSKSVYDDTYNFLPIPVPMIPLKNMKYHECQFKIHWNTKENVRCMIVYAFTDETLPDADILIHQVNKVQVVQNVPIKLYGMVKYLISDSVKQPTHINYSGTDTTIAPLDVYKYNHTSFVDNTRKLTSASINLGMPKTCQRLRNRIFIFHSIDPYMYMYDTNTYFGNPINYRRLDIPFSGVWSSCSSDTLIYACSLDGNLFTIDYEGNVSLLDYTVTHDVYAMYYYKGILFIIGTNEITKYKNGTAVVKRLNNLYNGSFFILGHPTFGNVILLFGGNESTDVWVEYLDKDVSSSFLSVGSLTIAEYGTVLFNTYDQLSTSIVVDGVQYIASGYNNIFQVGEKVYNLETVEQPYMTLIHDGKNSVYVYGYDTVYRYEITKASCFIPYCLNASQNDSTGFLNFNMLGDVIFKGCGNGDIYTVSYNFIRVQNGMSGLLYAH